MTRRRTLSPSWSHGRDRDAVRRAHREILGGDPLAVFGREAVLDSVQLLYDYGYSLTDIAVMFGVSRERVRQWFDRFGLERHGESGAELRIWDDALSCFVPVSRREYHAVCKRLRKAAIRRRHVEAARRVYARVRRPVMLGEVAEEAGYRNPGGSTTLATVWREPGESYREPLDRLFRAAGVPRAGQGGWQRLEAG